MGHRTHATDWGRKGLRRRCRDSSAIEADGSPGKCAPRQRTDVELHRDVLRPGQTPRTSTTSLSPWAVAGAEPALDFHIGLTVPGAWYSWDTEADGAHTRLWLADDAATSWASVDYDGLRSRTFHVAQHGPRRLWDEVTAARRQWLRAGRPTIDRYGLTVTPDTRTAWLDRPDNTLA
ncbi:hypothetical protein ACIOJD_28485 [Streptomyces sp. NPDC088116]|uniref:hypothetical protein n=1 Tax=Streptomyces sp. NPDC088116 TaxID=3365825 RepID=UPI003818E479